ncbi:hypothetical protein [Actinobacillus capsulatus]|uniref:hypothetical protein n=1 Tax=Actinobacillus capsulatus TaxID=717 RepID=UPI000362CA71|nr:hypothetical protein [Actinobacillus capsulatus]
MNKRWLFFLVATAACALFFVFYQPTDPALSVSVSTDGRYVVSGHADRNAHPSKPIGQIVLWDIEKKTKQIISKKANAFSAMFIPDSHEFMWQDDKNIIYMQNTEGQSLKHFQHPFVLQNHRMTADKSFYLSANMYNDLYLGYEEDIKPVYTDGSVTSKPVDLTIVGDYFLSVTPTCHGSNDPVAETNLTANPVNLSSRKKSSYDGVTLWDDKHTLKPVAKLIGNCGATNGLISPDGKWVITGGENGAHYMWEIDNPNNRQALSMPNNWGLYTGEELKNDKSTPLPEKLKERPISVGTVAHAFLSEKDFIGLGRSGGKNGKGFEFVALYAAGEPWIKAYVEIGNDPNISTNYFQRNLSVSSSPTAHILVTGQATGGGINVYKYHPDKMELEKIWVAD